MRKRRRTLTAVLVALLAAIYVVGFFLVWDCCSLDKGIDALMDIDFYATEEKPISPVKVNISFGGVTVSEEEERVISDFFTYYLAGVGGLTLESLAPFFEFETVDELFDRAALRYEIFAADFSGYSYNECTAEINVISRKPSAKSNNTVIALELSLVTDSPLPFTVSAESHSFTVDHESFKLTAHDTDRPVRKAFLKELDYLLAINGYSRADMAYTYYEDYIEAVLSEMKTRATEGYASLAPEEKEAPLPSPEYSYDRNAAKERALSGSSGISDNNDVSFTCECLFSAGIPMDAQGDMTGQWKWYDGELNSEREKKGHSKSWVEAESFYNYAVTNTGFGLSAYEAKASEGEIGDIVQLITDKIVDDEDNNLKTKITVPYSQCIITDVIRDSEGNFFDYKVCTDKYKDIPLRLLGAGSFRLIKIAGYNTANI